MRRRQSVPPRGRRYLCDVMLGGLARRLRALGFDAAYDREAGDEELARRASRERRVLLTRDTRLAAQCPPGRTLLLHANDTDGQLRELAGRQGILRPPGLFLRCTICNRRLRPARREEVEAAVPSFVRAAAPSFKACPGCGRVYWPGSHRRDMLRLFSTIFPALAAPVSGRRPGDRPRSRPA